MRVLRVLGGILLAFVGLAALIVGAAVAIVVGPDDTVEAEPEQLTSEGVAVVLPEQLFTYYGPTLHIEVEPESSDVPVFVGAAHREYVESYLSKATYTSIAQVTLPQRITPQELEGDQKSVPAPTDRTWWKDQVDGEGAQQLAWPLPNAPYDLVVMRADGKAGVDVTATVGGELEGLFLTGVLIAVVGLLLLVGGVLLIRGRKRRAGDDEGELPTPVGGSPVGQPYGQPARPAPGGAPPGPPAGGQHRTVAGSVVAVTGLVVLSGCVSVPQERTDAAAGWDPVTPQVMSQFLTTYDDTNNKANADEDPKLMATVEGGSLLRVSKAGFEFDKRARKNGGDSEREYKPFTHEDPTFYAPAFDEYPLWFLSDTVPSDSKNKTHSLSISATENAGSDWRTVLTVGLEKGDELPAVERDGDLAVAVAADDKERLVKSPKQVANSFADLVASSERQPAEAKSFSSHEYVKNHLKWNRSDAKVQSDGRANFDYETGASDVYALGTEDGGALVFFGVHEERAIYLSPDVFYKITDPDIDLRLFTGEKKAENIVRQSIQWQVAAVVPPKDAKAGKDAKIELLGIDYSWLGGSMD